MKKIIFLSIISLFIVAGCNKATAPEENFEETNQVTTEEQEQNKVSQEESETEETSETENSIEEEIVIDDVDFVLYENKAMGYKVMRPDKWYWQHFMKKEIEAAEGNELIDDYLIIDKNGITGLRSEYFGQIVIEKSRMDMNELAENMNEYKQEDTNIDGITAKRYEIVTDDNHMFPNRKIIEYHLNRDGDMYRLMYISNGEQDAEAIFEKVVNSFSFE